MREPLRGKERIGILAALVTIAAAIFAPASIAKTHHRCDGLKGKRHWGCVHRWHPKPPPFRFGRFELCVANRESGEPGSYSFSTVRWSYVGEGYEGAYNFVNATWLAMGGGRYARHSNEATPEQQTLIFRAHANSRDWPLTVPACE